MNHRKNHMKINFHYFQIQKSMFQTVTAEKVDEKMGLFVQLPCFLPELWSLNCPKKCIFCNFVVTSGRNLSLWKQIYIYASESSHYTLSQKDMVYRDMSHPNISETVRHTIINNTIFWKYVTRPFRYIRVNCFNRIRFLADVSTKLKKMNFFRQFKDHNSGRKHGN